MDGRASELVQSRVERLPVLPQALDTLRAASLIEPTLRQ